MRRCRIDWRQRASARYSITSLFTALLNLLVIKAVKGGLRFRTYDNILLARLAVTDVLTSLFGQPLYVLWRIFLKFGLSYSDMVENSITMLWLYL